MNRYLPVAAALALVVAIGGWVTSRPASDAFVAPALAEDTAAQADLSLAPDYVLGDKNAPVTFIEYASFTCPHCAHFNDDVFKQMKKDYIDTGKVKFILREVYFDQFGLLAAQIARCGGEMRYYGISDMLFSQQKEWIGSGKGDEIVANLRKLGKVAGLSDDQLDACIADKDRTNAMIAAYQKNFTADGIEGTPSFTINGELYTNMGYGSLKAILDEKLAAAN